VISQTVISRSFPELCSASELLQIGIQTVSTAGETVWTPTGVLTVTQDRLVTDALSSVTVYWQLARTRTLIYHSPLTDFSVSPRTLIERYHRGSRFPRIFISELSFLGSPYFQRGDTFPVIDL
jgi:hypothetical protein